MKYAAALSLFLPALALCQTNLSFSDGRAGEVPPGWFLADAKNAGFHASWQREGCRGTQPCAVLTAPSTAAAETFATLMQSFPAHAVSRTDRCACAPG